MTELQISLGKLLTITPTNHMNIQRFISFKSNIPFAHLYASSNAYEILKEVKRDLPFSCCNKTLSEMAVMESWASGDWDTIKKSKKQKEAERIASLPF